jgi:hypothetical protein
MKMEKNRGETLLLITAFIAVVISVVATGITYLSLSSLVEDISGFVSQGTINLTVESSASVDFTTNNISWGSGRVNSDTTAASLTTFENDNVTGGNWSLEVAGGLKIENIGSVNVSLNLSGTKTAATFIGGSNPVYQWNVSEVEANSCMNESGNGNGGLNLNIFHNVNTSVGDSIKCFVFRTESANDLIRIDFNLTVPEDSTSGILTDTITATVVQQNPS